MDLASFQSHELVGLNGVSSLCACGISCDDWLEHLGEVALVALNAPPRSSRSLRAARTAALRVAREDALWAERQQREHNLASFQVQPRQTRESVSPAVPVGRQLEIALQVLAKQDAA